MESMNLKVAVIMLVGDKFKDTLFKTYLLNPTSQRHDLIIVHRDSLGLPSLDYKDLTNVTTIHLENKILDGIDLPHRAFGAYRYYFDKYKNEYDFFVFISDDVHIVKANWLKYLIDTIQQHPKLGWGASQIFNGGTRYPHETHLRAPFWFSRTNALEMIEWKFNDDHDGEMKTGELLAQTGYIGIQIGNKIDFAYDAEEKNHISQLLKKYTKKKIKHGFGKKTYDFESEFEKLPSEDTEPEINSPFTHIGRQRIFSDIQPFHGLIYNDCVPEAKRLNIATEINKGIYKIDI